MPQAVIIEGGPREPRLQQCHHASLFQSSPHLIEGMIPIQNGEHEGFDPMPTREHMSGVRRDEAVDHHGDFQAPEHSKNQGQMCHRINLLHCHGHDIPPVALSSRQYHSGVQSPTIAGLASRAKIVWFNLTP